LKEINQLSNDAITDFGLQKEVENATPKIEKAIKTGKIDGQKVIEMIERKDMDGLVNMVGNLVKQNGGKLRKTKRRKNTKKRKNKRRKNTKRNGKRKAKSYGGTIRYAPSWVKRDGEGRTQFLYNSSVSNPGWNIPNLDYDRDAVYAPGTSRPTGDDPRFEESSRRPNIRNILLACGVVLAVVFALARS